MIIIPSVPSLDLGTAARLVVTRRSWIASSSSVCITLKPYLVKSHYNRFLNIAVVKAIHYSCANTVIHHIPDEFFRQITRAVIRDAPEAICSCFIEAILS